MPAIPGGFFFGIFMDYKKGDLLRPFNHLYENDWYWDHDKRLGDALAANGRDEFRADLNEISLAAGMRFPGPIFEG